MDVLGDWLALARTPGLGPRQLLHLLQALGSPGAIRDAPADTLAALGASPALGETLAGVDAEAVARDLAWLDAPDHHLLPIDHPEYPPLLRGIDDPPPLLFVAGDPALLSHPQIAIVGSRRATAGGRDTARAFARHLAGSGWAVTSGLALGIDAAAHEGALDATGRTVAVLATGPDTVYPAAHRGLAARIAREGALVTEFPVGTGPRREHFPRRNRIISGLAAGVLVVEAARTSGSLITARLAGQQGREVFAIPGSIHNPLSRGCHRLIRDGAKLVETAADIVEELAPLVGAGAGAGAGVGPGEASEPAPAGLDEDYRGLLEAMGYEPVSVDLLVRRSGLTAETVSSMLLILELQGLIAAEPGGVYTRVR